MYLVVSETAIAVEEGRSGGESGSSSDQLPPPARYCYCAGSDEQDGARPLPRPCTSSTTTAHDSQRRGRAVHTRTTRLSCSPAPACIHARGSVELAGPGHTAWPKVSGRWCTPERERPNRRDEAGEDAGGGEHEGTGGVAAREAELRRPPQVTKRPELGTAKGEEQSQPAMLSRARRGGSDDYEFALASFRRRCTRAPAPSGRLGWRSAGSGVRPPRLSQILCLAARIQGT